MSSRFLFNSGGDPLKHFYTTEDMMDTISSVTTYRENGMTLEVHDIGNRAVFIRYNEETISLGRIFLSKRVLGDIFKGLSRKLSLRKANSYAISCNRGLSLLELYYSESPRGDRYSAILKIGVKRGIKVSHYAPNFMSGMKSLPNEF